jgi:putative phosphoserine phosphatase/1-acylglycerol-3-phosphate O-acyltransferase
MQAKVPVVPIGLWGTELVWPRSSRLPNILNISSPPTIRVRVGEPITLRGKTADSNTKRIMKEIVALLPDEARVRRIPTDDELRRSYPSGYSGDPQRETERRPGTD